MTLEISKEIADEDFVLSLLDRIKRFTEDKIYSREADVVAWSEYVNNNLRMFSLSDTPIDVEEILLTGVDNIIYKESPKAFTIKIKEKVFVKNVILDVETFCKTVNYGNLSMPGIHIFTDILEDTEKNLDKLVDLYYSGEMI